MFCFYIKIVYPFFLWSSPKCGYGVAHCRYIVTTSFYTVLVFIVLLLSFLIFETFCLFSTYFTNTALCPDPGEPLRGKRHGNNFRNGSVITFTCNTDHELIGKNTTRCEDGVWSGSVPLCKGLVLY